MAVTDWKSPGTVVSDDTVGTVAWSNPDNAKTQDNTNFATAEGVPFSVSETNYLKGTNYGFEIPSGATINGIEVRIYAKMSGATASIKKVVVIGGEDKGDSQGLSSTNTAYLYGGSSALWNAIWGDTDINSSNFGVKVSCEIDTMMGSTQSMVDVIQIKVYYTESAGTPTVGVKYPLPAFKKP